MRAAHAEQFEDSTLPERPSNFSVKQTEFLQAFSASPFMSHAAICREIGIKPQKVATWKKKSPGFRAALAAEYRRSQQAANLNRKVVLRGMLESIELAKDLRQPSSMISGWKEVARMCGFYEPERRVLELSTDSKQLLQELQTLPKADLLRLMHEHESIDGDFEVVDRE